MPQLRIGHELEHYLRNEMRVNHANGRNLPRPYSRAKIELKRLHPNEISPTATYVLRENLSTISRLQELTNGGIFSLSSIHHLAGWDITPPVLEVWNQPPYNGVPVIVDGAHRLFHARQLDTWINCVVISDVIGWELPVLPLDGGWNEVKLMDSVPQRKRYYNPHLPTGFKPQDLYRVSFPGSTGIRPPVPSQYRTQSA